MDALIRDVKYNCDVSDARYWGYFSLCGLLMRMRDLYRDERNLKPWEHIDHGEILEWISAKEEHWKELQERGYRDVTTSLSSCDPFDVARINQDLTRSGLVYGAGFGLYKKPTFFIGELRLRKVVDGYTAYFVGEERARDIFTSAGMLQGRDLFIRLDALKTSLWEIFSEAQGKDNQHVMSAFLEFGIMPGMDREGDLDSRFEALTEHYAQTIFLHELAEAKEDVPEWSLILSRCEDRKTEYLLRQVKDAIADSSDHGPLRDLIERTDTAGLSLYLESLSAYQRKLCPQVRDAFTEFLTTGDWDAIDGVRRAVYRRFTAVRARILSSYRTCPTLDSFIADMKELEKSLSRES